jgi:hypothetical protein
VYSFDGLPDLDKSLPNGESKTEHTKSLSGSKKQHSYKIFVATEILSATKAALVAISL